MERVRKQSGSREDLRQKLSIDKDNLDDGLIEQPDLYYHVAEAYVNAVSERDALKLDLENATAELDKQFREQAVENEEKLTETALKSKISSTPRIKTLEKDLLRYRVEADHWQALKEAFQQRSFMLRELVAIYVRRMGDLSLERGSHDARDDFAMANRNAAARLRERKYPPFSSRNRND